MLALLKHLSNLSIEMKQDYLISAVNQEDNFLAIIKKLKPQIETCKSNHQKVEETIREQDPLKQRLRLFAFFLM